jgi:hypothetical protein
MREALLLLLQGQNDTFLCGVGSFFRLHLYVTGKMYSQERQCCAIIAWMEALTLN